MTRTRDACVEAVAAATLVALVEGVRVGYGAGIAGVAAIAGAAWIALAAAALAIRAGVAIAIRLPPFDRWIERIRAGGGERVAAAWSALLVAGVALAFAVIGYRVFAWAHTTYRFHDSDAIGASVIAGDLAILGVLVLLALAIDRAVRPRLPAPLPARPLAVLALCALAVIPPLAVRRAVPQFDVAPIALAALLVALVIGATLVQWPRAARWAALGIAVASLAGTWSLASLPRARLAIVEHGAPSKLTAQLVWRLGDHDDDGFPGPSVGGADCDDANAARHPGAADIIGNGVDENCSGADASPATSRAAVSAIASTGGDARPTIVLISVDALRADRLGAYGYARKTPAIDALAAHGARFAAAYTSCPSTRCAIPALHTGRFHPGADAPTLAAVLHDRGYETAAITCCERFADADRELVGFGRVDATADSVRMQRAGQSNADVVVDRALAWLATPASGPRFLWVHLYEPHSPYDAPSGPDLGDSDSNRYDREVAFADTQIARLVAAVPDALVVVTADHGEELGEHGIRFHARSLYNQVIRIPLIVAGPGVQPHVVDTPVSLTDVMPTLLALAGAAIPAGTTGVSLAAALRGAPAPTQPVLIELPHDRQIQRDMAAVVSPPWKVIWDRESNAWSLYRVDDVGDATEESDSPALAAMQRLLQATLDRDTSVLAR